MMMAQAGKLYDSFHEYEQDNYQPNDRFYVRASVYLPQSEVDPRTGLLREGDRRTGRTQARRMEARQLEQEYAQLEAAVRAREAEKGVRIPARYAALLIVALLFVLGVALLMQQGYIVKRQQSLKSVTQAMEANRTINEGLQAQIAEASDSVAICYAAARDLGMVPAESTQAIHLTAMETRPGESVGQVSASAVAGQAPLNAPNPGQ